MVYDVILNGIARVGKDTFTDYVAKAGLGNTHAYSVSSIDPFRELPELFGWNGKKDNNYRMCLKLLKEASTYIDNYPTKFLLDVRKEAIRTHQDFLENLIIFYHIREPLEIEKLKAFLPNAKTVLLRGSDIIENNLPPSDVEVLNYKYDYTLYNKGSLEELQEEASLFLSQLKEGK